MATGIEVDFPIDGEKRWTDGGGWKKKQTWKLKLVDLRFWGFVRYKIPKFHYSKILRSLSLRFWFDSFADRQIQCNVDIVKNE